jgi:hypothetical protein
MPKPVDEMKKEYKILALILLLAYILRILPYLLGYSIPITDDSLRDFEQVKYIIENKSINFNNHYGAFPVLHIIIFLINLTGISSLKAFLFAPQIFSVIGILFFYLFLRKYFKEKESLFALFLIAVFSMHIYWSSQPVRETLGLFFFPLVIYLFDKEIEKESLLKKALLFLSFSFLIMSHNWSTLMTLFFLFFYSIFFIKEKRVYAFFLIGIFVALTFFYWWWVFDFVFELISNILKPIIIVLLFLFLFSALFIKRFNPEKIKKRRYAVLILVISFIFVILSARLMSFSYPIQMFINPAIILFCILIGFFFTNDEKINNFLKISIFYFIFPLLAITNYFLSDIRTLHSIPFDTLRILEFVIFPLSILAASGLIIISKKINKKYLFSIVILILIISGTFVYPLIFIYKTSFENTIFYDIRSDIRYIPEKGFELIKWANNNNYNVVSNNYVINEYQNVFYTEQEKRLILISEQDYRIMENYEKIRDKKFGIPNPEYLINKTLNLTIVYSNEWGSLYKE